MSSRPTEPQDRPLRLAVPPAAIFARMQEAIVVVDLAFQVLLWSPGAEWMFDWTAEETIIATLRQRAMREGAFQQVVPRHTRDGRAIRIDVSLTLIMDTAGQPAALLAVSRDVTEREAHVVAREAAWLRTREHERFLETLFAEMDDAVIVTGSDLRVQAQLTAANAQLRETPRELPTLATIDQLTGTSTRRAILDVAQAECRRARDERRAFTCIMADVDHFKQVNDRFGHLAGGAVLRHLSAIVRRSVRSADVVGRYGGEEFLIICPQAPPEQAAEIAERVRRAVEEMPCRAQGTSLRVTLSLGVASATDPKAPLEQVLHAADAALYAAKHAGRNRVVVAGRGA